MKRVFSGIVNTIALAALLAFTALHAWAFESRSIPALWSPVAGVADTGHPLEPLDLSSPRATLDAERQQASEAQVRAWCSAQELPFPTFTAAYRNKTRNTLAYPPEGAPEASA